MNSPKHEHDCDICKYLETRKVKDRGEVDFYHCPGSLGGIIIGRHGSEREEYWSWGNDYTNSGGSPIMQATWQVQQKHNLREI